MTRAPPTPPTPARSGSASTIRADLAGWAQSRGDGIWAVAGGVLAQTNAASSFSLLDSPSIYTDAMFMTSVEVVTDGTPAEIGFCLGDDQDPPGQQYYCCGIVAPTTARAISAWPGSPGQVIDGAQWSASHAAGAVVDMTGMLAGTTFACRLSQGPVTATHETTPVGNKTGTAVFYTGGLARYRYLFVATIGSG